MPLRPLRPIKQFSLPNFRTRRGEILLENIKEWAKVILLAVMIIAIIALGISSCTNGSCGLCGGCSCGCAQQEENAPQPQQQETQPTEEDKLANRESLAEVQTYPRLINGEHALNANYVPPNLTRLVGMPDGSGIMLEFTAATAFDRLYNDIVADGLGLIPLSGYRTYQEQVDIFAWNLELHINEGMTPDEARAHTATLVAIPGTSEHQYGRSLDVTIDGTTNHTFHETEQGKWLIAHAHEYGFVVRYPSDKTDITGIAYEPWHLRYVGKEHAAYMKKYDLCLEEYIALVRQDNPAAQPEA
ncbi:MAG: D-alanyl-D-alanine carboxypeptidase family protein [Ruminococcaceae bacterium]|nr:D-alanyl-D-alanine carboxypeptidase family protein [Oscillospiraceae bacterium]